MNPRFIFSMVKKLSLRKCWNIVRLFSSYHISKWRKRSFHQGMPMNLSIEPTTACNLRCPECPSGLRSFTRPTGNLKADFFRKTIDEVHKTLVTLMFYFQGEPYINPDFLDMVAYAAQKDIFTITSTNGHFLSKANCEKTIQSGLDKLIISIDGTTQEVYEQYRKEGKLATVLEGCRQMIAAKKRMKSLKPFVFLQFLVVKPNEHQIPELYDLAKELGVDGVGLKTAQLYAYKNGNPLMPTMEEYSRYRRKADGTYELKYEIQNQCWRMWNGAVITWDGKMVPCCFDKDAEHSMGNLQKNSLKEVWKNEAYEKFRNRLLHNRKSINICQNCSEGTKVWA